MVDLWKLVIDLLSENLSHDNTEYKHEQKKLRQCVA